MLNEGETKRRNKAKKNKLVRENFPQGQASDDTTPAENPHGTNSMGSEEIGHKRGGKKAKGVKAPSPGKLARVVKRTKSKEGKRRRAKEVMSKNTAGPVGRLPDHTVYHDMGMLMAESLGLVSEEDKETPRRPVQSTRKPSRMAIPSSYSPMTPKQKRMSDAMDRDRKLLRRRAGASGNETSTD